MNYWQNDLKQNEYELKDNLLHDKQFLELEEIESNTLNIFEEMNNHFHFIQNTNDKNSLQNQYNQISNKFLAAKRNIDIISDIQFKQQIKQEKKLSVLKNLQQKMNEKSQQLENIKNQSLKRINNNFDNQNNLNLGLEKTDEQLYQEYEQARFDNHQMEQTESDIKDIHQALYGIRELVIDANKEIEKQGENLLIIQHNVEQTKDKVNQANKELTQANKQQGSSKQKYVALCFLIAFVIFIFTCIVLSN